MSDKQRQVIEMCFLLVCVHLAGPFIYFIFAPQWRLVVFVCS